MLEPFLGEPHSQSPEIAQDPHGVLRRILNVGVRARQCVETDTHRAVAGSLAREDKCLYTNRVRFEWDPRKADLVDKAGGGNYQTLINDALLEHIQRRSTLDAVRQAVREALAPYASARATIRGKAFRKRTI